jgi:hypothetical protein
MDITLADLDAQAVELLPTREALHGFTEIFAVNKAMAFNAAHYGGFAQAIALQSITVH